MWIERGAAALLEEGVENGEIEPSESSKRPFAVVKSFNEWEKMGEGERRVGSACTLWGLSEGTDVLTFYPSSTRPGSSVSFSGEEEEVRVGEFWFKIGVVDEKIGKIFDSSVGLYGVSCFTQGVNLFARASVVTTVVTWEMAKTTFHHVSSVSVIFEVDNVFIQNSSSILFENN